MKISDSVPDLTPAEMRSMAPLSRILSRMAAASSLSSFSPSSRESCMLMHFSSTQITPPKVNLLNSSETLNLLHFCTLRLMQNV